MELFNFVFDQTDMQKPLCMTSYIFAGVVIGKGLQVHEFIIQSWLKDLVFLSHFHLNSHPALSDDLESLCTPDTGFL